MGLEARFVRPDALVERRAAPVEDRPSHLSGCAGKQGTVLYAGPAKVQDCQNFIARNIAGQSPINTFVEQQLHDAVSINRSLANSRKATT